MTNSRRSRNNFLPVLITIEDKSIATADTASNTYLYGVAFSASTQQSAVHVRFRSCVVQINNSTTESLVFAVIRRVPHGYSPPAINIATAIDTFVDSPNIVAYGYVLTQTTTDQLNRINLKKLNSSIKLNPGDALQLQVVSNTSSVGQTYSSFLEYDHN